MAVSRRCKPRCSRRTRARPLCVLGPSALSTAQISTCCEAPPTTHHLPKLSSVLSPLSPPSRGLALTSLAALPVARAAVVVWVCLPLPTRPTTTSARTRGRRSWPLWETTQRCDIHHHDDSLSAHLHLAIMAEAVPLCCASLCPLVYLPHMPPAVVLSTALVLLVVLGRRWRWFVPCTGSGSSARTSAG